MKRYKSHKVVEAFKIDSIDINAAEDEVVLKAKHPDVDSAVVTRDWCSKHGPGEGGYFVKYKDGYTSFSPAEAFEEGYTEVDGGIVERFNEGDIVKLKTGGPLMTLGQSCGPGTGLWHVVAWSEVKGDFVYLTTTQNALIALEGVLGRFD